MSVALVAVYAPGNLGNQVKSASLITGPAPEKMELPNLTTAPMHGRNLWSVIDTEELETALQVYEEPPQFVSEDLDDFFK